jgi:hypothetical protein
MSNHFNYRYRNTLLFTLIRDNVVSIFREMYISNALAHSLTENDLTAAADGCAVKPIHQASIS